MTRDATATASPGAVAAWGLTGRISPRRVVRAAAVDADGHPLNSYPLVHPVTGAPPWTPWAAHLADAAGPACELITFEGADHCGGYFADRPAYIALVEDFLRRALPPRD